MLFDLPMETRTLLAGISAFVIPQILVFLTGRFMKGKIIGVITLLLYLSIIFQATLLGRKAGTLEYMNLTPFWSYQEIHHADIRWQVYMNVFLFIPFGFIIGYFYEFNLLQSLMIGCSLSIAIECFQLLFKVGLCEFDDVFHNTLGMMIGYFYYKVIRRVKN